MKVTTLGIVAALKNLGMFFASYQIAGIQANPTSFFYAMLIYACVSVPSDLYLLNHASESAKAEAEKEKTP